jgi:hypothetical protein
MTHKDKDKTEPKAPDLNRPNMSEADAAFYLGLSVSSLRKSRMNGSRANHLPPPPYVKLGRRVIYRATDLARFLESHLASMASGATE